MPKYVILDFETTGLEAPAEIIEIGAIKMDGLEIIDRFQAFVRPERDIPLEIQQLTGITPQMLEREANIAEIAPRLLEFAEGLPFVSHNASMELGFLNREVLPHAIEEDEFEFTVHDSIDLMGIILPDHHSHSMASLRKWAQLSGENSHRADQDCMDLVEVLKKARAFLEKERTQIAPIVDEYLHDWWWKWFFEDIESRETLDLEFPGDLRKLRTEDEDREIDWSQVVDPGEIEEIFQNGANDQGYDYRSSQVEMSQEVLRALTEGSRLAIEGPTGTGKSIAYLVPGMISAEMTGAPLVVSTHSKTLQDQLIRKDIPAAARLIGSEVRATTVKGQNNYLCLRKLDEAAKSAKVGEFEERWSAAYFLALASTGNSVEVDHVSRFLSGKFPSLGAINEHVRSHFQTTIGPKCPHYKKCHFFNSARKAHQSDVIVANHALVFHWPAHLPQLRNVIFDEAHHLEDQITDANTVAVGEREIRRQIERLSFKDHRRNKKRIEDGAALVGFLKKIGTKEDPETFFDRELGALSLRLDQLNERIRKTVGEIDPRQGFDMTIQLDHPALTHGPEISADLETVRKSLEDMRNFLAAAHEKVDTEKEESKISVDLLSQTLERFRELERGVASVARTDDKNALRLMMWNTQRSQWYARVTPIDVAALSGPEFDKMRTAILTSATLSTSANPNFVSTRIGLKTERDLLALSSPYDLYNQAKIHVPQDIPPPGTPEHLEMLIDVTEQVTLALGGRTLLLISSNQRLRQAAIVLRQRLEDRGISVFDSLSDANAIDNFKNCEQSLLIGGEKYGEGIDIPGERLSCVIIEKINEAMTRGALAEARKARTQFGIFEYDFPLRMIWLKQRVGRLIRSSDDRGHILLMDPRYYRWSPKSKRMVEETLAPISVKQTTRAQILQDLHAFAQEQGFKSASAEQEDSPMHLVKDEEDRQCDLSF